MTLAKLNLKQMGQLSPDQIQDWVSEEILAGRLPQAWSRLHQLMIKRRECGLDPLQEASILLAYARLDLARGYSLVLAEYHLQWARDTAAQVQVRLEDFLAVEEVSKALSVEPRVVDGRFAPDKAASSMFARRAWVRCGRCQQPGLVHSVLHWSRLVRVSFSCLSCAYSAQGAGVRFGPVFISGEKRCGSCGQWVRLKRSATLQGSVPAQEMLRCPYCEMNIKLPVRVHSGQRSEPTDPCYGMPLLLSVKLTQGFIYAYNGYHLAQLRCYVEARVRDERDGQGSWFARLPSWIKSAKNRSKVLHAINRLDQIAEEAGVPRTLTG